jgi:putative DNA primase/helicase
MQQQQQQEQNGEGQSTLNPTDTLPLSKWRGSVTTFNGFTGTRPAREFKEVSWDQVCVVLCPPRPAVIADKSHGQYFVPCLLKEAPLVGSTRDAAMNAGQPTTGKMRSKGHVTDASMVVMDVDGLPEAEFVTGLRAMEQDGLSCLAYTTHSHGCEGNAGVRGRVVVPVDRPLDVDEYSAAWHGLDRRYWAGNAGKADPSGANLYQQQGVWSCHPDRTDKAQSWRVHGGVASSDVLIAISRSAQGSRLARAANKSPRCVLGIDGALGGAEQAFPTADANKVANACRQIGSFRDSRGAGQSEPRWRDCLGVVGHCDDGAALAQAWSSGHPQYNARETADKLTSRLQFPPTTCAQFRRGNPAGCEGCTQQCNSPITLGWSTRPVEAFEANETKVVVDTGDAQSVAQLRTEPRGQAETPESDDQIIARLASLTTIEYGRVRKEEAKALGIRVATLDDRVKAEREEALQGGRLPFTEVAPHPDPVDPAQLFDEVSAVLRRLIVMDPEQADAVALWIPHTYLTEAFEVSPLLILNAPEKACGKTLSQTVVSRMCYRPLPASNASSSALFRAVELWMPTILIDEADTFFRDNPELHGLINAGYARGGYVLRSEAVGDSFEPKMFPVYSAKSIAGIALERHLPDATMSRGIVVNLRRKRPDETVLRLRDADVGMFELIAAKLARFAEDHARQLRLARPALPDQLSDRAQDNWEPLLAIAECAGPEWVQRATAAALSLSGASDAATSTGNELLADIHEVFENRHGGKISTTDLIATLVSDGEKPWATYNRGQPISPRQLAKQLDAYGIKSKTVRLSAHNTPKGYEAAQFDDAFARYLGAGPNLPQRRNGAPDSIPDIDLGVADRPDSGSNATPPLRPKPEAVPDREAGDADANDGPDEAPEAPF